MQRIRQHRVALTLLWSLLVAATAGGADLSHPSRLNVAPDSQTSRGISLLGHMGGKAQAIFIQGNSLYLGMGTELTIFDITLPTQPVAQGKVVLPDVIEDVFVVENYAYVAASYGGLRIVDVSTPMAPSEVGAAKNITATGVAVANKHAYVTASVDFPDGTNSGLHIFDVSNPRAPLEVAATLSGSRGYDVTVQGDYAYIAGGALFVVDISVPRAPREVNRFVGGVTGAIAVAVADNYAYVVNSQPNGLQVVDVSDPRHPVETDSLGFHRATEVAVAGKYAYVVSETEGLQIVDISDPGALIETATVPTKGANSVQVAGSYAFVGAAGLHVVDATNPRSATIVRSSLAPAYPLEITVAGTYAYVGDYWYGMQVIDVSNASAPTVVGSFATASGAATIAVHGSYAYLAVRAGGLHIIDISNPRAPLAVSFIPGPVIHGVTQVGTTLYLVGGDRLQIFDVSTPSKPSQLGSIAAAQGLKVTIVGGYAYIAVQSHQYPNPFSGGLQVVDVSNPQSPAVVAFDDSTDAVDVIATNKHAFIAGGEHGLVVYDVSNPWEPSKLSSVEMPRYAYAVAVMDRYAYVADLFTGLRVVDVAKPHAPVEVGFFDTPYYANGVAARGNEIYMTNGGAGLFIFRSIFLTRQLYLPYVATYAP